ncbi:hypothetical protein BCR41DRAFT_112922 [Lobosporangium transversale]|uniref:Uncharacterized protein n=1 Tax=Lobosporangium transversale TaxID=64571 RepID=A0A1Y2GI38_9FUNG|nr:hypothetical protein BCR41DRAFT_112922 [Lobosporangium transversale]ORZ11391.1 hypothetical protein BCR41DRAFT_112922 [Lobosporangium transversale]|eukprot:XP_021879706.1 hypothetical protein BCR41DRAFT_112922 [Lobosporangium transversale]
MRLVSTFSCIRIVLANELNRTFRYRRCANIISPMKYQSIHLSIHPSVQPYSAWTWGSAFSLGAFYYYFFYFVDYTTILIKSAKEHCDSD